MDFLIAVIAAWLSIAYDLPESHSYPKVYFLPAAALSDLRYANIDAKRRHEVVAIYSDKAQTIYLSDTWSIRNPADISILVHEMVHHLQNSAELEYECPAARERLAYEAQAAWLKLFGRNLSTEFNLDPMTLKITTSCTGPG